MSNALSAINDGIDYQARLFWIKACDLLSPKADVSRVAYERGPKGFDDISVHYDPPRYVSGRHIEREHFQCKWHVRPGDFTGADLCDPKFINAKARSFLEIARDIFRDETNSNAYNLHLATNWHIDSKDALSTVFRNNDGRVDLDKLFDGSSNRSGVGRMRKLWLDKLAVSEEELREIVGRLVFLATPATLVAVDQWLDGALARGGLRPVDEGSSARSYDDIARKLLSQRRVEFSRAEFMAMCEEEQRVAPKSTPISIPAWTIGVRSFMHKTDNIDDRCDAVLDLIEHFDGRYPRVPTIWKDTLIPKLDEFLIEHAGTHEELLLVLDAHASLAYAAGSVLDVKAGKNLSIEQRFGSKRYWSFDDEEADSNWPTIAVDVHRPDDAAGNIYCAVGISHDVENDVNRYIEQLSSTNGVRLVATMSGGASNSAVKNGRHAWRLCEELVRHLRLAGAGPGGPHVHLFIAAPNAFTFYLGQHSRALGPVTTYEFDFDGDRGGGYAPGFSSHSPSADSAR